MSQRLIVRSEAEADLSEAARWYEDREAGLGLPIIRLITSLERSLLV